jgi:hypothetical protein
MVGKHKNNSLMDKFCRCIKAVSLSRDRDRNRHQFKIDAVRKTVKLRNSKKAVRNSKSKTKKAVLAAKESAAIAICVNAVLKTRGKTLKKFSCKNKKLITQKL